MIVDLLPTIDLDFIVLFFLVIIAFLYKKKFHLAQRINLLYFTLILITMSIILLEILDKVILLYPYDHLIPLTKSINILGFSLSPLAPFLYLQYLVEYFNLRSKHSTFLNYLKLPIALNALICLLSYSHGYIFYVSESNHYTRGPLFLIPMILPLIYFLMAVGVAYYNRNNAPQREYIILTLLAALPILAAFMQIFLPNLLLLWGLTGMVIIAQFLYLQESLINYDSLTKIWNRLAFESHFNSNYLHKDKQFTLGFIDLNEFKQINDIFGHNEGDIVLQSFAKNLHICFKGIGQVARLAGDEFVFVTDITDSDQLNQVLHTLQEKLDLFTTENEKDYALKFSVGYQTFNNDYSTLTEYLHDVDTLMYLNKKNIKFLN